MKKLILLSLLSSLSVSCTSTRVDDHSYHYNDSPAHRNAAPVNVVNNYINNSSAPAVRHIYEAPKPQPRPYQEDEDFLQYRQEPQVTPSSYKGLHIQVDRNHHRTVVPARWDIPNHPAIPSGNASIPVFYRY
jgi:hypothetical protein